MGYGERHDGRATRKTRPSSLVASGLALVLVLALPGFGRSEGRGSLLVVSHLRNHFLPTMTELKSTLPQPVTVMDLSKDKVSTDAVVWAMRSGTLRGVVAVGQDAVELARRRCPDDLPLVCMPYGSRFERAKNQLTLATVCDLRTALPCLYRSFPERRRVSLLHWSPELEANDELREAARKLGCSVTSHRIESWRSLRSAIDQALKTSDLLWLPLDPKLGSVTTLEAVLRAALLRKKPVLTYSSRIVRGGALACPVFDARELASEARRWLELDERERESWVTRPPSMRLQFNGSVARYLGYSPPPAPEPPVDHGP